MNSDRQTHDQKSNNQQGWETKGTGQEEEKRFSSYRRNGLGDTRAEGIFPGDVEIAAGREDRSKPPGEQRTVGGVIRQLKTAKQKHLEWVEAHEQRLMLRLAEDQALKQKLLREIDDLEQNLEELQEADEGGEEHF